MKLKFTSLVLAFAMVAGIGAAAHAQSFGMMTSDLVTLKLGFTPLFERNFEDTEGAYTDEIALSAKGINLGAEYAINLGEGMFLGLGLEYLYAMTEAEYTNGFTKKSSDFGEANLQYLSPMATFKYVLTGGCILVQVYPDVI
jgi:hypothetical protein